MKVERDRKRTLGVILSSNDSFTCENICKTCGVLRTKTHYDEMF